MYVWVLIQVRTHFYAFSSSTLYLRTYCTYIHTHLFIDHRMFFFNDFFKRWLLGMYIYICMYICTVTNKTLVYVCMYVCMYICRFSRAASRFALPLPLTRMATRYSLLKYIPYITTLVVHIHTYIHAVHTSKNKDTSNIVYSLYGRKRVGWSAPMRWRRLWWPPTLTCCRSIWSSVPSSRSYSCASEALVHIYVHFNTTPPPTLCIHPYIHTYIHIHTYVCTYKVSTNFTYIYTVHIFIHTCIHSYIHTYIHTYIHIYTVYVYVEIAMQPTSSSSRRCSPSPTFYPAEGWSRINSTRRSTHLFIPSSKCYYSLLFMLPWVSDVLFFRPSTLTST